MINAAQLRVVVGADVAGALGGLSRVNKAISGTGSFFGNVLASATGFGLATLGLNALGGAAGFVNDSIIGLNSTMEQQQTAFTNLLGGAAPAQAFLGQLRTFANQTAFSFTDVTTAAQRLLAVGLQQGQIIPLLTNVAGAAQAMGLGREGVNRLTLALAQMQSKGRVQGDELLQLSEAGIPGLQLLATALGKTTIQTQKLVESGKVSAATFLAAFMAWGKAKGLPGIVADAQKTWEGATNTIIDTIRGSFADAFFPLFELLREGAVNLAAFLQTPAWTNWVATVRASVAGAVQGLGTWAVMIGNIAGTHGLNLLQAALIATEIQLGQSFGPQTASAFHNLFDGIQRAGDWLLTNGPKFFGWLVTNLPGAVETGVGKLAELTGWLTANLPGGLDTVTTKFGEWKDWLTTNLPGIVATVQTAFTDIQDSVIRNLANIQIKLEDMILSFAALPIPGIVGGNPLAAAAGVIKARGGGTPAWAAGIAADTGGSGFLGGGAPLTVVNMNGTFKVDTPEDVQRLLDQVAAAAARGQQDSVGADQAAVMPEGA